MDDSFKAMMTAPIIAAVSSRPMSSSGKTYFDISRSPMFLTEVSGAAEISFGSALLFSTDQPSMVNTTAETAMP